MPNIFQNTKKIYNIYSWCIIFITNVDNKNLFRLFFSNKMCYDLPKILEQKANAKAFGDLWPWRLLISLT